MKALVAAAQEVWGLFVEDGTLAIGILIWVAVAAFAFPALGGTAAWHAPVLFGGLVVLLIENVFRSAKSHRRS